MATQPVKKGPGGDRPPVRPPNSQGGKPNEGVPGDKGPRLDKNLRNRIDVVAAAASINVPGITSKDVRLMVKAGMDAGLNAKQVLRFVQSKALGSLGSAGEGTLRAVIDGLTTDPTSLVAAVRLSNAFRRGKTGGAGLDGFGNPITTGPNGDPNAYLYSGANSYQSQLFDLFPALKEGYVGALGHKLIDSNGDGIMDRVVPIDPNAEDDRKTPPNEDLTLRFGAVPEDDPFVYGDETTDQLQGTVASMLQARQAHSQAAYGEHFSYSELLGEEEQ